MSADEPLKGKEGAALALARGEPVTAAAALSGVAPSTLTRWQRDPELTARDRELRSELLENDLGAHSDAATAAVTALRGALQADSEAVRVLAAVAILNSLVTVRDATEVAERLTAIEDALKAHQDSAQPRQQI